MASLRALAVGLAALAAATACTASTNRPSRPAITSAVRPATARTTARPTTNPVPIRRWHRRVEELFVHPLVLQPRLAFTGDQLGTGFQGFFVTALEFRRLLDQLWRHGWTLVDVHRAAAGTVRVPVGRRPLVLSEDDVNYYRYFAGRGLARRLVLAGGRVLAQLPDGRLTDQDVVPLVEEEVALHPEFAADGARGVLALTGYEGLFGEHHLERVAARRRVRALGQWLGAHGWTIASHTWGHVDLSSSTAAELADDTARWTALPGPLLGRTDVLVYPFGARPDDTGVRQLVRAGFRIQLDIDVTARRRRVDGAIVMSRRHVDGYAFQAPAQQAAFYDVARVRDPARP